MRRSAEMNEMMDEVCVIRKSDDGTYCHKGKDNQWPFHLLDRNTNLQQPEQ